MSCPRPVSFLTKVNLYLTWTCLLSFCIYDNIPLECQSNAPFSRLLRAQSPSRAQTTTPCYLVAQMPSLCAVNVNWLPSTYQCRSICLFILFLTIFFSLERERERERERETPLCCSTYLCIYWPLPGALTGDQTYNSCESEQYSNQLSYLARTSFNSLSSLRYSLLLFSLPP